jgi:hypothetical protein
MIFLSSLTQCNTSSFLTLYVQLIFSILLQVFLIYVSTCAHIFKMSCVQPQRYNRANTWIQKSVACLLAGSLACLSSMFCRFLIVEARFGYEPDQEFGEMFKAPSIY